ncbi:PREDICTED: serine/threonine-kinase [Prunus dulcis]|uniref:PREDICTED: serine/threonine-kinase n=1 Tax=Prunus dulcis TaxID=3755 RepID=A0A5E4FZ91_PRUDU|nr:PREDICTED: serine/threonine-kinase [Prunus dulcis]
MGPNLVDEGEGVGHVIRGITDPDGGSGSEEDAVISNGYHSQAKKLSGEILKEFGLWTRLAVLQLGNNSLGGQILGELANYSSLVWLDLNSNRLTGEIPPRLGRQLRDKSLSGILSGNTLVFVQNITKSCKRIGGLLEFA